MREPGHPRCLPDCLTASHTFNSPPQPSQPPPNLLTPKQQLSHHVENRNQRRGRERLQRKQRRFKAGREIKGSEEQRETGGGRRQVDRKTLRVRDNSAGNFTFHRQSSLRWDPHRLRDGGPGAGHLATALGINFGGGGCQFVGSLIQNLSSRH